MIYSSRPCWDVYSISLLLLLLPPDQTPQCRLRPEAKAIVQRQSQETIARLLQDGGDFPPPVRKRESFSPLLMMS